MALPDEETRIAPQGARSDEILQFDYVITRSNRILGALLKCANTPMKKPLLPVVLLLFVTLFCQGTRGIFTLGVDEGLSQGSVFDMVQDDQGFIWIATADGLNRYDGYNFRTYKNDPKDSLSLQHTHLRNLFKGKDALWITTSGTMELYRMDFVTGRIRKTAALYSDTGLDEVCPFKEDGDTLWLLASDHGIIKLNTITGKIIDTIPQPLEMFPVNFLMVYDSLNSAVRYIGDTSSALCSYFLNTGEFKRRSFIDEATGKDLLICGVTMDVEQKLWIGCTDAIICYDPISDQHEKYALPVQPGNVIPDLVISLIESQSGEMWCGTEYGALYVFDVKKKMFSEILPRGNSKTGSVFRTISLMMDRTQNLWVGTDPDGVKRIDTKRKPFNHTYRTPQDEKGLTSNFMKCFLQIDAEIYIGTFDGGINVLNRESGTYRYINGFPGKVAERPAITSMSIDSAGTIWVTTYQGIGIIEKGSNQLTRPELIVPNERVNRLANNAYVLPDQSIQIACPDGMIQLKKSGGAYEVIEYPITDHVEDILSDRNGNLWVGSSNGIHFLEKNASPADLKLIVTNIGRVKCIYQDVSGVIWASGNTGLNKIDPNSFHIIKTYSESDGMPNSFVYGILDDAEHNLWISTNKGISKFNPGDESFRNYSVSDGLQSNEFNTGAFYKSPDGELFFGGVNGFNHFYPKTISDNPFTPNCVITGFSVFDKPLVSDTVIERRKHIALDYTQNNILIEYTGLEFSDPLKNKYLYRMIGLDTNWTEAGKERFARFVNLDPGEYTFQVKASNNDGIWNVHPVDLRISITPPFWKTLSFIIGVTVIGVLLLVVSIRFYFRRKLKQKTKELELKQSVRVNAIFETEEKERKRIAGELHDGIGQLLSTAKLNVSGFGENIDPKYNVLYKNSLQLLDQACEEVRTISHNMMPGALIRMGLMTAVNEMIIKINDAGKIKVDFDTNLEERFDETIEISVYRIIQEALNNMVKHSQAKNIQLRLMKTANQIDVSITDDGKGFDVSRIAESKGLGWRNMYSRVEILRGSIEVDSAEGKGTSILIVIPIHKS